VSTTRLYFADPYLTSFRARVVARAERGGRPSVALDQSSFYPEGGGQPADHGVLGGVAVVDVQVDDDGVVWHTTARAIEPDDVEGAVDWTRRFDHMQQHHGQHLLSAAFERLYDLRTVSFHLGADYSSIDLSGRDVSDEQLAAAEALTNQVIWEDRPVNARFVTREELGTIPLRKPPVVEGAIRVVSVPDFDHSACGGTHPRATGGVGVLHVRRRERRGEETRVEFVCGGRALRDLRMKHDTLQRVAVAMTVGVDEVESSVRRLRENEQDVRRRLAEATERLLELQAGDLVASAPMGARGARVVRHVLEGRTVEEARTLARGIIARGAIALIGIRGEKGQLLVGRPDGLDLDSGKLVREVVSAFGGKGGGQPAMAQGGIPDASNLDAALAKAADQA
jgi:alanyl-tRNA synthetase